MTLPNHANYANYAKSDVSINKVSGRLISTPFLRFSNQYRILLWRLLILFSAYYQRHQRHQGCKYQSHQVSGRLRVLFIDMADQ